MTATTAVQADERRFASPAVLPGGLMSHASTDPSVLLLFSAWWVEEPLQVTRLAELEIVSACLGITKRAHEPPTALSDCVREENLAAVVDLVESGRFRAVVGEQTEIVVLQAHLRKLGLPRIPALLVTTEGDFGALQTFGTLAANDACADPVGDMVQAHDTIWSSSSRGHHDALLAFGVSADRVVYLPYCSFLRDMSNPASREWHARPELADPDIVATAQGRLLAAGNFNRDYVTFLEACAAMDEEPLILTDVSRLHETLSPVEVERFQAALARAPCVRCQAVSPHTYIGCLRASAAVVVPLNRPNFTSGHLTIADAQLVRSPVVATDLPTTRDFIEHGRSGLLYALHDAASLREQLIRVRREPALAAAIAAEGQRSEARLSETTRAAFLEALRRLVAIDRPAPSAPRLRQARRPEPETPGARRTTHHQRLRQLLTAPAGQWELQDWRETQTEVVVTVTASRPERLETTLVFTPRGAGGRYLKRTRDYLAGLHGSGYSRREQALGVAVIDWVRRQERQQERQLERQQDPSPATPARGPQRVELSPLPSEDPGPAKPRGEPSLIFDVEVTNRCNLHCRMCPRERMTRPQGNMTQATFYRLLGELSRLPTMDTARVELGFAGQGEPLLHPDLPRFVAAATARLGCRVGITTNGLLLDERRGRQLREAGLGTVHVSVHGLGALHDEIVGATAFERVQRNVERFSAQAAGAVAVQIVLVVSELNRARLDFAAFHRFWTERGARGVERIECHSRGGNLRDPTVLARASDVPAECSLFLPIHFFAWTGDLLACCSDLQGDTRIGSIGDCSWPELLRRKRDIGKPRHAFLQCRSCPDWIPPEVLVPGPDAARGPGSR